MKKEEENIFNSHIHGANPMNNQFETFDGNAVSSKSDCSFENHYKPVVEGDGLHVNHQSSNKRDSIRDRLIKYGPYDRLQG